MFEFTLLWARGSTRANTHTFRHRKCVEPGGLPGKAVSTSRNKNPKTKCGHLISQGYANLNRF
jgi:hypothetical protein